MSPVQSMLLLFLILLCNMLTYVTGKYEEGHLVTSERWAFLSRFCFLSEKGRFEYFVEYEKEYATQNLLLYYDTQWPAAYSAGKTCLERESYLNVSANQVVNLTDSFSWSGCMLFSVSPKKQIYSCHRNSSFRTARERWWFLAVSNCNGTKGLNLRYKILMTNGPDGDFWHNHFSADEFYILPILLAYFSIYLLLLIAVGVCAVQLKSRKLFHSTYKLFVLSVVLQQFGIIQLLVAYLKFGMDGRGFPGLKTLGQISESASETVFLLLLLLLAKGFTVTRGRLRLASSVKLTIFMCLYVVTSIILYVYKILFFDPGKVLYIYESIAGFGIIVLRVIAWGMFVYSIVFTLNRYPGKAAFYYPFNIMGALWFVAGPAFILAANGFIDKWVRESVVCGVLHFIALCGHLMFLFVTLPVRANKVFPYHVRTSQVGVMALNRTDDLPFVPHSYAPATAPERLSNGTNLAGDWVSREVPVELFSVSRNIATATVVQTINNSPKNNGLHHLQCNGSTILNGGQHTVTEVLQIPNIGQRML